MIHPRGCLISISNSTCPRQSSWLPHSRQPTLPSTWLLKEGPKSYPQFFALSVPTAHLPAVLLILLPKRVTKCLASPHRCCDLPVQSPSFFFWIAAPVFWPVSLLPCDLCSTKQQESPFKGCPPPCKVISLSEVVSWFSTVVKLKSWPLYPEWQSPLDAAPLPLWPQLRQLCLLTVLCSLSKPARQPKGPLPNPEWGFLIFPCWPSSI